MSSQDKSPKKEVNSLLNNIVDFGPETDTVPPEATERICQMIKKLQEISERIDRLVARS